MAKGHEAILADISDIDFLWGPDTFSDMYLQALLDKIAPEEDLVLTYYYECRNRGTDSCVRHRLSVY